ncbi:hypothetical protein ThrDRAFT_04411 [Frankia casuarinae]|uniref:hypothetical protein n=1 Tax=Frankia TaxID=1854 RepID=UPI0003CFABC1|nr:MULTISPECIES: hypothetical protein [Frankia]ETA01268.1 hypothetical protein CcI6DRAFT_03267 [Frankia sp. CcI6]EYT89956.1 hypothetical protein ThrDRAFT_04411 [Frankia casuarinae]KDA42014.1 hypothetical protein BMG523Draft_03127 [Frankia sp. BMG5.23]KFB06321.1 hypothetical protein ALLO2DRAFT_00849 [Frankia sp. Allo2]OAA22818.1 hypothetical protein AAY23_106049 [Frankia casuarinae]
MNELGRTPGRVPGGRQAQDRATAGFDRLRPRGARSPLVTPVRARSTVGRDAHGKRALYSGVRPVTPPNTSLTVNCSRCGQTSSLGAWHALRVLTPSVHLPLVRLRHPSLVRCPSCRRLSWVRLGLHFRPAG